MSKSPTIYLNGKMLLAAKASLPLTDWGLHGVAATEMTRTFRHACFRLEEHLDRLQSSLEAIGIENGPTRDEWREITRQVLAQNVALIAAGDDLLLNHYVTAGGNPAYGATSPPQPTVCVQTFPLSFFRWAEKYATGGHLIVPDARHIPPRCIDPRIKSRNRLHWYLADRQAKRIDETATALLLDEKDYVTETSAGNFFIVNNGVLLTPRFKSTLNGISQSVAIEIANELEIPVAEYDLTVFDVYSAEEAFTSSTPYCLLPVTRVNSQQIGAGKPGPVYCRLMEAWNELVGMNIIEQATAHSTPSDNPET